VDNDGDDDLLISTTMLVAGKAGTLWDFYLCEGSVFRWIKGTATLRRDACFVGYWKPLKRNVVASYWPGGANTGSWHAVYVEGDKITDVPLEAENKGAETELDGLKAIKPEEFLFDELKKKYESTEDSESKSQTPTELAPSR
jgi:hypothetical protein